MWTKHELGRTEVVKHSSANKLRNLGDHQKAQTIDFTNEITKLVHARKQGFRDIFIYETPHPKFCKRNVPLFEQKFMKRQHFVGEPEGFRARQSAAVSIPGD